MYALRGDGLVGFDGMTLVGGLGGDGKDVKTHSTLGDAQLYKDAKMRCLARIGSVSV